MDQKALWDTWNKTGGPKYPHEKVVQFFFRNFPNKEERQRIRVLDLGCGSGVHTIFLADEGFLVSAIDFSEKAIENVEKKITLKNIHSNVEHLKVESISNFDFPDSYFDVVLSISVFDAAGIDEVQKAIPRISKVLKKGGIGFFMFASNLDFRLRNNEYGLHGYSEEEVKELFLASNYFEKVWIDRYITTYQNQLFQQNDFIITVYK